MKTRTIGALLLSGIIAISLTSRLAGSASGIKTITPAAAWAGDLVTITGNGFGARNVRVLVGGAEASVISATGNRVTFRVPAGVPPGPTLVTAINPGGHVGSIAFTVLGGAPIANAGPDQTVPVGAVVELDGSASSDPNGQPLFFEWSLLSRPTASHAVLSSTTAVRPTLVADAPGTYELQLVVSDGATSSEPDTVLIDTLDSPPIARAGPDQTARVGSLVQLDGTAVTEERKAVYLSYRTSIPLDDCAASQAEGRKVWAQYFKAEAERQEATMAFLFPEYTQPEGRVLSQTFTFIRREDGTWEEGGYLLVPCHY